MKNVVNTATTGCAFLDSKGVDCLNYDVGAGYCLNECPYQECVLDGKFSPPRAIKVTEYTVQCMKCGTLETVFSHGGQFENSPHFIKMGDTIWHLCFCGKCKTIGKEKR